MSESPISSVREFVQSLTPAQRAWYLEEHDSRERLLQRTLSDLGRALSGLAAAHGECIHVQQSGTVSLLAARRGSDNGL